ncbi:MAG: peptide-methionine (R)-S-oxide reductase MsrB [Verrucomicrobiales bacterium]|jgi:peptide-methionine (R)-S-oxide reductase|nr:peptide-methionine (R)-S-oxide reductase MsrB [Verrucomicrobiales bacterium]
MMKTIFPLTLAFALIAAVAWIQADDEKSGTDEKETIIKVMKEAPKQPKEPVERTEEEWKKILTPEQYRILREEGTERANGKVYDEFKKQGAGTYYCAGCDAELFTSDEKFDSRCGWPSFYDPAKAKNVKYKTDFHLGYARTEVRCKICDGHLGHVFEGEGFDTPTDKRYCINGTVLKFVPAAEKAKKDEEKKKAE